LVIITVIIVAVAFCCLLIIIIFYPRQSLFSAHTHTTHNNCQIARSYSLFPWSCSRPTISENLVLKSVSNCVRTVCNSCSGCQHVWTNYACSSMLSTLARHSCSIHQRPGQ